MEKLYILLLMLLAFSAKAQIITNGPDLKNEKDRLVTKIIDGNDSCFFTYRLRTKGEDTYFMIEKYNKKTLVKIFATDLDFGNNLENILAVEDKLYIFFKRFNEEEKKMSLLFQVISEEGKLLPDKGEVLTVETSSSNFVDFDIIQNPDRSKFIVKASYRSGKTDEYQTNFLFLDPLSFRILEKRSIGQKFFTTNSTLENFLEKYYKGIEFMDFTIDSASTIYYGYICHESKGIAARITVIIIPSGEKKPELVEMNFLPSTTIKAKYTRNNNNELIVAGFFKRIEKQKGHDGIFHGIFGFTINLSSYKITSSSINDFDELTLDALDAKSIRADNTENKLDYIFANGKNVFIVGEQFELKRIIQPASAGTGSLSFNQKYMDVIIAKYDPIGKFEWIKNTPFRYSALNVGHNELAEYIAFASDKKIYILNNESPFNTKMYSSKNYKPSQLLFHSTIRGTNCVYSSVTFDEGKIEHKLILYNDKFCFSPESNLLQTLNTLGTHVNYSIIYKDKSNIEQEELFLKDNKAVYLFTHQKGMDRFVKMILN